jgi:5-formyltetrahydrofolate cyclo-ligase
VSAGDAELAEQQIRQRAKVALRKQMRGVRAALPASACDARSARVTEQVLSLDEFRNASIVAAFASIGNEVRTRPLIEAALTAGKRVALPRVDEERLVLHQIDADTKLAEGAFGVPEPPASAAVVAPEDIELAWVPALAVDPRGYRIGYGGGYYDRLIPALVRARSCALAYDFQLIAEVPELPFDARVDLVVTDARVIRVEG